MSVFDEIVKTCKKHGPLTLKDVRFSKKIKQKNPHMNCRLCTNEYNRRYYERMPDAYIKAQLGVENPTPEMIELKRASIMLRRKRLEIQEVEKEEQELVNLSKCDVNPRA